MRLSKIPAPPYQHWRKTNDQHFLIIFAIDSMEIGHITGKGAAVCDRMPALLRKWKNCGASPLMRTAAIQASRSCVRWHGHDPLEPTKIRNAISATHLRA